MCSIDKHIFNSQLRDLTTIIKNSFKKKKEKRLGLWLSDRVLSQHVQGPIFNTQHPKKTKNKLLKNFQKERFQDGGKREEAESVPPKVKSWRDAGDTPYRKNHQEEAKL
jgi:hypothetical protein